MFQGDEWKVMGLAGWGEPEYYQYIKENVLTLVGDNEFRFNASVLDHHLAKKYMFSRRLTDALGPRRDSNEEITVRHQNIAASAQKALEEIVLRMLTWLHKATGEHRLCLAGGVILNSLMNGRIIRESPFNEFFFQPAAGDSGCALGACYHIWHSVLKKPRGFLMEHSYWGPSFTAEECQAALRGKEVTYEQLDDDTLTGKVARCLADGQLVARFQGRMEWGPRALGNRSFLADPRRPETREKLNKQVKLREWFRPLAPSLLAESAERIFGVPYYDPFMITVHPVRESMREALGAVVHVDGTARPQTVRRDINPSYWNLVSRFEQLRGIPCLLNTSFNIQEPIVCTPEDAVATFLRSSVPLLVLENNLVRRKGDKSEEAKLRHRAAPVPA